MFSSKKPVEIRVGKGGSSPVVSETLVNEVLTRWQEKTGVPEEDISVFLEACIALAISRKKVTTRQTFSFARLANLFATTLLKEEAGEAPLASSECLISPTREAKIIAAWSDRNSVKGKINTLESDAALMCNLFPGVKFRMTSGFVDGSVASTENQIPIFSPADQSTESDRITANLLNVVSSYFCRIGTDGTFSQKLELYGTKVEWKSSRSERIGVATAILYANEHPDCTLGGLRGNSVHIVGQLTNAQVISLITEPDHGLHTLLAMTPENAAGNEILIKIYKGITHTNGTVAVKRIMDLCEATLRDALKKK